MGRCGIHLFQMRVQLPLQEWGAPESCHVIAAGRFTPMLYGSPCSVVPVNGIELKLHSLTVLTNSRYWMIDTVLMQMSVTVFICFFSPAWLGATCHPVLWAVLGPFLALPKCTRLLVPKCTRLLVFLTDYDHGSSLILSMCYTLVLDNL